MSEAKLVTLFGDDKSPLFRFTEQEAAYGYLNGEMPSSFYIRNPHANDYPEELGSFFEAIAGIVKAVVGTGVDIAKMAQSKRMQRRDARNASNFESQQTRDTMAIQAQQQNALMQQTQAQKTKIIVPVAIAAVALIAVVLIMKGKKK